MMRERLKKVFPVPDDRDVATASFNYSVADISLVILATCGLMAVLYWAQEVFIPIVLSILISYALEPVVRGLTRIWVPRLIASGLVVLAFTGALLYGGYAFSDDVGRLVAELPEAAAKLRESLRSDEPGTIQQVQEAARELQRTADEAAPQNPAPRGVQRVQIEQPTIDLRAYVSWGSAGAIAFAGQATLIFFFVFFLLASGDLFKRKLVTIVGPSLGAKRVTVQVLDDINKQIERFLLVRVVTSVVVALATWGAFEMVGLNQAGFWGVAAGVFNSVPYFGPVIVAAGTFVVAFIQFDSLSMAAYVSGISLAITALEGWLLTPWLTSRTARTNEIAVFVGLIFWSFVWGIWGTLLAVPMLVVFKAFCDHLEGLKPVGELLGE
jgi:predicted PurR-regulated permease PerM